MSVEAPGAGHYTKSILEQRKLENEISAAQIWQTVLKHGIRQYQSANEMGY